MHVLEWKMSISSYYQQLQELREKKKQLQLQQWPDWKSSAVFCSAPLVVEREHDWAIVPQRVTQVGFLY